MIKFLKVNNTIYENFEPKQLIPTSYDEQGNPTEFQEVYVFDPTKLKDYVKDTVIWLTKAKINEKLSEKGFYSIGDVLVYKNRNDQDAIQLYEWYISFDTAVWDWIENTLPKLSEEELLEIDLKSLVENLAG
ncbi:MAG: hypothetical protein QW733_07485 [Desulfurococcaceae archaeon]